MREREREEEMGTWKSLRATENFPRPRKRKNEGKKERENRERKR